MAKRKTKQQAKPANAPKDLAKTPQQAAATAPADGEAAQDNPPQPKSDTASQGASDATKAGAKPTPEEKAAEARKEAARKAAAARKKAAYEASLQEPYEHLFGDFPIAALKSGFAVRRKAWSPGFELTLSHKGTRGKRVSAFYQSGTRSGQIEWKPKAIDDLVAGDWLVIMTVKQAIDAKLIAPPPNAAAVEK